MDRHNFTFPELHPSAQPNIQPYLRILVFFNKKEGITEQQMAEWWRTVHADLSLSTPGWDVHVSRYVQFIQPSAIREQAQSYGMELLSFSAMGEMHVKSLEEWVAFSSSPAFSKTLVEDGGNFMAGPIKIMIGHDNLVYGSKIESSGGIDGVLPGDRRFRPKLKL
ncbi:hypothetical protein B0J11DRAFT_610932 [Dendryphion nanum]|uniref:EthD domain-containing protein n=1 Tax=Dendryphion nanum TaxID=256645 RepID=A0A9P9ECZ9_9PLEO|nr:hypothetical protein B0J11DRAFT_610932 [Dendryphion nanum]